MSKTAFKGSPVNLAGEFINTGITAPDFTMVKGDLSQFKLSETKGKFVVLNIFPSLDTGVCATSVRKFNQLAAKMDNTVVLAISKDVIPLSDFRNPSDFDVNYGVLIADGPLSGLLARSVVVINPEGKIIYTELVPEITQEPDYEAALAAIK